MVPVTLDGVVFVTDPRPYDPLNMIKRDDRVAGVALSSTIQDTGLTLLDTTIRLGSGETQVLDKATVKALTQRAFIPAAEYAFSDWLGNEFSVYIHMFHPVVRIQGMTPNGVDVLFTYDMELYITDVTKLFGEVFPSYYVPGA